MADWHAGILTKAGRELLAKVEAGNTALEITRMKLGSGSEKIDEVDLLTDLTMPQISMNISSRMAADGICTISGVVLSSQVKKGFYAREFGIFANDPEGGEILYMVTIDEAPDFVPPQSAAVLTSVEYAMSIVVANVSELRINVDPNGLVTVDMLDKAADLVQRNTSYDVGDILHDLSLKHGLCLKCVTPGITGSHEILIQSQRLHDMFKDGTCDWMIVRENTTSGDLFRRNADGNITISGSLDYSEGIDFQVNPDGGIVPVPKRFCSNKFIRTNGGFIMAPADANEPIDSDPLNVDEKNSLVVSDSDIDHLVAGLS